MRLAWLPTLFVFACTSEPSNPNADASTDTASTDTASSDTATSESETGNPPESYPEPEWSIEFPATGFVVHDFEVNGDGEILLLEIGGGEFQVSGSAHKLDGDGAILWSVPFDEVPLRICARPNGGAFVLLDASLPEDNMNLPILRGLDTDGVIEWTIDIEVPTPPDYNDLHMACERDANGVFVTGQTGEDNAFLVHYDNMGSAGDWIEPLFAGDGIYTSTDLTITDTGLLLLGAYGTASGANGYRGYLSRVNADGTFDLQVELDTDIAPFVVVRSEVWASAGRLTEPMQNDLIRVDQLENDLTSVWTTIEGETYAAGTTRPLTVDDQGRIIASFPNPDNQLRVAVYDDQGNPEITVLNDYPGYSQVLGIDGQGRLLVGGTVTIPNEGEFPIESPQAWIAAYDLSSL